MKCVILFLTANLVFFVACVKPESENNTIPSITPLSDNQLGNRTWQFMSYGNTDSVQLNLPEDAAQYTLILSETLLVGTTPFGSFTAKYTLFTDKKISIDSLTGTGINESHYIKALQELRTAYKYEVSNEALKIFYSDKQYLLFVEKNEQYPKKSSFIYFYTYPFNLESGEQIIINNRSELFKRCNESTPYIPYSWAIINGCSGFDLDGIDFSNSSLLLGCIGMETDIHGYKQELWQVGNNTYHYKIYSLIPSTARPDSYNKLYYGMLIDKVADNATIIYNIDILDHRY